MPIIEYKCAEGHVTEVFYRTISAAEGRDQASCGTCLEQAARIISTPLPAHLYGDPAGYHKPSPSKRFSNKLTSKEGNK